MNNARIVVMQLASAKQVKQWRDHCATALGGGIGAPEADAAGNLVVWQLSSANHRPLARSTHVYADFDAAMNEVQQMRAQLQHIKHRPLKLASRSEYVWVGSLGAQSVLMSARTYTTVRDARDSIAVAAEAFSVAVLGSGARLVTGRAS